VPRLSFWGALWRTKARDYTKLAGPNWLCIKRGGGVAEIEEGGGAMSFVFPKDRDMEKGDTHGGGGEDSDRKGCFLKKGFRMKRKDGSWVLEKKPGPKEERRKWRTQRVNQKRPGRWGGWCK